MRRLTDPRIWLGRIVRSPSGQWILFAFALLEAAVLPVPIEAVLAPYMQVRRDLIWRVAGIALGAFLLVSLGGYAIGYFFFDEVGLPIVRAIGAEEGYAEARAYLLEHGFWALVVVVMTPVPAPFAMIGGGALGYPLAPFVLAMLVARGVRYLAVALLVLAFGDRVVRLFTRSRIGGRRGQPGAPPR